MAMTIMNNTSSMMALGETKKNNSRLSKDLKKVASGMKLNSAGDDASSYAISEKMRVMLRSLNQDIDNSKKGIDLIATAEGGMHDIVAALRSMKEMAINSANDHNTEEDRKILQKVFANRMTTIDELAATTNYNGKILMDGRYGYTEYDENDNPIDPLQFEEESANAASPASSNTISPVMGKAAAFRPAFLAKAPAANGADSSADTTPVGERVFSYTQNSYSGLFPAPSTANYTSGTTVSKSRFPGITGYAPPAYGFIERENTGYNIYSITQKEQSEVFPLDPTKQQWKRYRTIPPVGTIVHQRPMDQVIQDYDKLVVDKDPASGRSIFRYQAQDYANGNIAWESVSLDFANAKKDGSALSYPNDLHASGFSMVVGEIGTDGELIGDNAVSIILDATLDAGTGVRLSESPEDPRAGLDDGVHKPLHLVAYKVGIKGANTAQKVNAAVFKGLKSATSDWNKSNYTGRTLPAVSDDNLTHLGAGLLLANYNGNLSIVNPPMSSASYLDFIIADGLINLSSVDVGKLDTTGGSGSNTGGSGGTTGGGTDQPKPPVTPTDPTKHPDMDDIRKARRLEGNPLIIHYGPKANQHLRVYINDMHSKAMGLEDVAVTPREKALAALSKLDAALNYALNEITNMGAYQSRLRETTSNLTTANENVTHAESVIRDSDMAKEMTAFVKDNVLAQASQSMLAQANQNSSSVLNLLQK